MDKPEGEGEGSRRSGGSRGSETSSRFVSDRVVLPLTPASVHAVLIEGLCAVAELRLYSTRQFVAEKSNAPDGERDHNVGGVGAHHWHNVTAAIWSTSRRRRRRRRARRCSVCRRCARQPTPAITPCPHTTVPRVARRHALARCSAACCAARSSQIPRQAGRPSFASGRRQCGRRRAAGASAERDLLMARAAPRDGPGLVSGIGRLVACECVSVMSYIRTLFNTPAHRVTRRLQGRRAVGVQSRNFAKYKIGTKCASLGCAEVCFLKR